MVGRVSFFEHFFVTFPVIDNLREFEVPSSDRSDDARVIEDVKPLFVVAGRLPSKAASDCTIMGMYGTRS